MEIETKKILVISMTEKEAVILTNALKESLCNGVSNNIYADMLDDIHALLLDTLKDNK